MPANDQGLNPIPSKKDEVEGAEPRLGGDLSTTYAALLPGQLWQVDGMEGIAVDSNLALPTKAGGAESKTNKPEYDPTSGSVDAPPPVRRVIEALLFLGGEPLTSERAGALLHGLTPTEFTRTIDDLNRDYHAQGRPYRVRPRKNGYEMALKPRFLPLADKLHGATREARLSPTGIDVLALVAYRQPIAKKDIDSVRGAESGSILRQLVRRGLLSVDQLESGGKPETVYRTTQRFLDLFQLRSPEDLPQTNDLKKL
jgi:segregation and condensation protein B